MVMNKYTFITQKVSEHLDRISDYTPSLYSILGEAQKYSLTAGGKHLRGLILCKCAMLGGCDISAVLDYACALEMVHTYSLIHDDLPEMDNDDLRRGKPTCHVKYGTDIALLAGDALLTKAFNIIALNKNFSDSVKIKCIKILSECCGENGMLAGQVIDKQFEGCSISAEQLDQLHQRKTGDMFLAAVSIGCTLGNIPSEIESELKEYIFNLGSAFQIKDDILDVLSSSEVLGKPIDSDKKAFKSTYVSLFGIEKAESILNERIDNALKIARKFNDEFFADLAVYFSKRIK